MIKKELKLRVYFSHVIESSVNLYSYIIEKHLYVERGIYEVFHTLVLHITWLFMPDLQRPTRVNSIAAYNSCKCCSHSILEYGNLILIFKVSSLKSEVLSTILYFTEVSMYNSEITVKWNMLWVEVKINISEGYLELSFVYSVIKIGPIWREDIRKLLHNAVYFKVVQVLMVYNGLILGHFSFQINMSDVTLLDRKMR